MKGASKALIQAVMRLMAKKGGSSCPAPRSTAAQSNRKLDGRPQKKGKIWQKLS
jgi:hypothetical protein